MSIWRTKHLEKILNPKIFITSEEQDFINQLWADSPEMSYVSDDANFWKNLDAESYANLEMQWKDNKGIKSCNSSQLCKNSS